MHHETEHNTEEYKDIMSITIAEILTVTGHHSTKNPQHSAGMLILVRQNVEQTVMPFQWIY